MELTIKERLSLIQLLPTHGSLCEMVDVYDLVRELKLSDEEKAQISYKEEGNSITWDYNKDPNKDVKITSDQIKLLMKQIDDLDNQKQIPLSMVELIIKLKNYG